MKTKTDSGNFFEDFKLGHVFQCPIPRTLNQGDISNYISMTGDRTPRFCDARAEIHPLLLFHLVLGQTVRQISLNAKANLGYAGLLWQRSVAAGDTISTTAEVIGLKENSNQKTGIVYVKTRAQNQHGKEVLQYNRWVMVNKRDEKLKTEFLDKPIIPELPSKIEPEMLWPVKEGIPTKVLTGGNFLFEDYKVGERIDHVDGLTVNTTEHMSFTRLFQNGAKIHFDNLLTDGKPLVYGGFPMSLGYALSFNGLQNRTGICAINAGAHANPVYAADTLYAFSEVLEKKNLGPDSKTGAVRLRMIVTKNMRVENVDAFHIYPEAGKKVLHQNIVLDLDYWDQIATGA